MVADGRAAPHRRPPPAATGNAPGSTGAQAGVRRRPPQGADSFGPSFASSISPTQAMLRELAFLRPYKKVVARVWALLVVGTLLGLAPPALIQGMIDNALALGSMSMVGLYGIGVVAVGLIHATLDAVQRFSLSYSVENTVYDIRNTLYEWIIHLPFGFHDRSRTGQLISRLTGDIDGISRFFGFGLTNIISILLTFGGASIMLFRMSWQMGLLAWAVVPPMVYLAVSGSRQIGPRFYGLRQQFGRITGQIQENYAGVRVVKAFAREDHERLKFSREQDEFVHRRMDIIRIFSVLMPSMSLLTNLGIVAIFALGGRSVIDGKITIGQLVASQGYMMMLTGPIRMIGWLMVQIQQAVAAGQRIFEIMDTAPEIAQRPEAIPLPPVQGEIRFEHVSFGYEAEIEVLHDCNLLIRPRETVAVMGATGSGKTSVINLIPRFYDVSAGKVTIDGHDVRDVTLASLRAQVGTIFQEAFLFSGTIAENIAYGRDGATMEEIIAAAKMAQAHDFVMAFAEGYQTRVGERGVTLSGGQRQRLTIARALLLNPPILIMDDSTSSVDVETEFLIQQALQASMKDRTSVVIAHRLSTVKNADRIVVLDQGRIVEEGTHDELMALDGHYRRIYETQLAEQEEEVA